MPLHLKMHTPERTVYDADVEQITLPTLDGEITVLPHHIPLISVLKSGEMRVVKDGVDIPMVIAGGFVEVRPDSAVDILADSAERIEEIDLERAEAARIRAEEYIKTKKFETDVEYAALQAALERAMARIRVIKKHRR